MYDDKELPRFQKEDGSWDKDLQHKALDNQRLQFLSTLIDVIIKGVKFYAKDEEKSIRQQSLDFLERIYQDLEIQEK